ncbi:hypothetical protein AAFF_G00359400 [Aldrovandia affinis]|uniref:Uncharacterized protein n=1 Tax=Aldrovandia affinis TaxID=143900 RepID=A0AAD7SI58_9TELE|nr:hypothetical protein AAFF_G00359400 [Aldrovandia affinis]
MHLETERRRQTVRESRTGPSDRWWRDLARPTTVAQNGPSSSTEPAPSTQPTSVCSRVPDVAAALSGNLARPQTRCGDSAPANDLTEPKIRTVPHVPAAVRKHGSDGHVSDRSFRAQRLLPTAIFTPRECRRSSRHVGPVARPTPHPQRPLVTRVTSGALRPPEGEGEREERGQASALPSAKRLSAPPSLPNAHLPLPDSGPWPGPACCHSCSELASVFFLTAADRIAGGSRLRARRLIPRPAAPGASAAARLSRRDSWPGSPALPTPRRAQDAAAAAADKPGNARG